MLFFKPNKPTKPAPPQVIPSAAIPPKRVAVKRRKRDPRTPLIEGTRIEHYRLSNVIGRGSFSLVYQAKNTRTRENVVIKEYFPKQYAMRKGDSEDVTPASGKKLAIFKQGFMQFFTEAIALKNIRHPNALQTTNIVRANKTTYMVYKSSGGQDLKRFLLASKKPLDRSHIYSVFLPILSALNYLHSADLLHLDIKPANILLQTNGQPLLIDFGAAQSMSSKMRPGQIQTLTHGFAPPEQYDKGKALGPWTDIYAVAATLYHCITGRSPSKAKRDDEVLSLDLDVYSHEYGSQMINAVNRALSQDASDRYVSVDEFALHLLEASKWRSLREYEINEMKYNRDKDASLQSQAALCAALA